MYHRFPIMTTHRHAIYKNIVDYKCRAWDSGDTTLLVQIQKMINPLLIKTDDLNPFKLSRQSYLVFWSQTPYNIFMLEGLLDSPQTIYRLSKNLSRTLALNRFDFHYFHFIVRHSLYLRWLHHLFENTTTVGESFIC